MHFRTFRGRVLNSIENAGGSERVRLVGAKMSHLALLFLVICAGVYAGHVAKTSLLFDKCLEVAYFHHQRCHVMRRDYNYHCRGVEQWLSVPDVCMERFNKEHQLCLEALEKSGWI